MFVWARAFIRLQRCWPCSIPTALMLDTTIILAPNWSHLLFPLTESVLPHVYLFALLRAFISAILLPVRCERCSPATGQDSWRWSHTALHGLTWIKGEVQNSASLPATSRIIVNGSKNLVWSHNREDTTDFTPIPEYARHLKDGTLDKQQLGCMNFNNHHVR